MQGDRLAAVLLDLDDLLRGHVELAGQLLGSRLATEILQHLPLDPGQFVDHFDHVDGDADGPRLVGHGAGDRLADPPRGVGGELVTLGVVELLDRADQAQVALLDQVQEEHAAAGVALGQRDHQAEVGLQQVVLGAAAVLGDPLELGADVDGKPLAVVRELLLGEEAGLDALGQLDLLLGVEQRDLADLLEVVLHRVGGGSGGGDLRHGGVVVVIGEDQDLVVALDLDAGLGLGLDLDLGFRLDLDLRLGLGLDLCVGVGHGLDLHVDVEVLELEVTLDVEVLVVLGGDLGLCFDLGRWRRGHGDLRLGLLGEGGRGCDLGGSVRGWCGLLRRRGLLGHRLLGDRLVSRRRGLAPGTAHHGRDGIGLLLGRRGGGLGLLHGGGGATLGRATRFLGRRRVRGGHHDGHTLLAEVPKEPSGVRHRDVRLLEGLADILRLEETLRAPTLDEPLNDGLVQLRWLRASRTCRRHEHLSNERMVRMDPGAR